MIFRHIFNTLVFWIMTSCSVTLYDKAAGLQNTMAIMKLCCHNQENYNNFH